MSLALLQSYSSAEEEEGEYDDDVSRDEYYSSDEEPNGAVLKKNPSSSYKPLSDPNPTSSSSLPSAFHAFSQVAGPPQFLNNSVKEEVVKVEVQQWRHGKRRKPRDKKDLPLGAVLESKAQLTGIHERVRSDVGQGQSGGPGAVAQSVKRVATAGNPNIEDAAELLRMCVKCGIPKTYTHGKGVVCPVCGDKPPEDSDKETLKKKGSAIKDKEKSKRMKGQSSHASWKSETEMQLRQQFD